MDSSCSRIVFEVCELRISALIIQLVCPCSVVVRLIQILSSTYRTINTLKFKIFGFRSVIRDRFRSVIRDRFISVIRDPIIAIQSLLACTVTKKPDVTKKPASSHTSCALIWPAVPESIMSPTKQNKLLELNN